MRSPPSTRSEADASRYDYEASKELALRGFPFYALIMAAMRDADAVNLAKLRCAWPETWAELDARYNAPGGILETDDVRV
jgi:hypothetical protein